MKELKDNDTNTEKSRQPRISEDSQKREPKIRHEESTSEDQQDREQNRTHEEYTS